MSWQKLRQQILKRDNNQCQICNLIAKKLDIHHIIPLRKNGLNSLYNLVAVCRNCHTLIELDPPIEKFHYKLVKIKDETHQRLKGYGKFEDSFDDIINRLMDLIERK